MMAACVTAVALGVLFGLVVGALLAGGDPDDGHCR